jgi:DNA repair exonuclease SbcCD ATPase subunit
MVSLFGGGRISKNKKLKGEVEKIDKDIKKLLEEFKKDPLGWHPQKNEEYRKLIEKILKEIEEHKKSLHELYGFGPNGLPELENLEYYLREYYKKLEAHKKGYTIVIRYGWLENLQQAIQTNWDRHKIKF